MASLSDTIGPFLEHPVAMTLWRDSVAVADLGAAQIVVLPRSLERGRAFGVGGEVPGERNRDSARWPTPTLFSPELPEHQALAPGSVQGRFYNEGIDS